MKIEVLALKLSAVSTYCYNIVSKPRNHTIEVEASPSRRFLHVDGMAYAPVSARPNGLGHLMTGLRKIFTFSFRVSASKKRRGSPPLRYAISPHMFDVRFFGLFPGVSEI